MKKYIVSSMGLLLLFTNNARATIDFSNNEEQINTNIKGSTETLDQSVQTLIRSFAIFASLIAIPLTIGGIVLGIHLIGKKRKTLGIVIIIISASLLPIVWFLYSIVSFIITNVIA